MALAHSDLEYHAGGQSFSGTVRERLGSACSQSRMTCFQPSSPSGTLGIMRDGTGAGRRLGVVALCEACWKPGRGIRIPRRFIETQLLEDEQGGGVTTHCGEAARRGAGLRLPPLVRAQTALTVEIAENVASRTAAWVYVVCISNMRLASSV